MDIRIKVLIGVLWSLFIFAASWKIEDWHYSSQREGELQAALKSQTDNTAKLVDANNKEVAHIDELNDATTQDQVHTQLLIQAQNDALAKLDKKVSAIHVGTCTIAPAAGGLLLDAYKAAGFSPQDGDAKGAKTHK